MDAAFPRVLKLEAERFPVYYVPLDGSTLVKGRGYRACIVFAGEDGFHPTGTWPYHGGVGETLPYFWGPTLTDATKAAEDINERNGVTKEEAGLIVLRSMGRGRPVHLAQARGERGA